MLLFIFQYLIHTNLQVLLLFTVMYNYAQKSNGNNPATADVASSAGVKHVLSLCGVVHSELRNRLGTQKAAKLVFLFKVNNQSKRQQHGLLFINSMKAGSVTVLHLCMTVYD